MILFFFYTGWTRYVVISSEGEEYLAGTETILTAMKGNPIRTFDIVHHYDDVRINPTQADIDLILGRVIYEARGTWACVYEHKWDHVVHTKVKKQYSSYTMQ